MTPDGALKYILKKDDMKVFKYLLECVSQVEGDVLEIAVTIGNQEIVSLLLNRGADPNHFSRSDVYTGFVLGCFAGTDGVHQIKILLQRPGHTKTKTVSTCSFICIWIILDIHFEKAGQAQDDSISEIVLRASMKHSIFDDETSKWTSDDQPVFDGTCWLQNYKIQLYASCIHTKGKTNVYDQNLHCTEVVKDLIMHIFDKRITQLMTGPDPESDFKSEFETQSFQMTKRHTQRLKPMLYSSQIEKQKLPYDENDVKEMDTSAFDRCLHFWKNNTERLFAIWHSEEQMAEAFDWCLQRTKINYKRLFVTWHLAQLMEEQECDTFNTDSIQLESTSDEECSNRNKLLPSKTAFEDDDDTVVQIEKEDSFGCEQIIRFTEMNKRLETYIQWSLSNIDCDLFAEAGFFYTGEKFVCFCCNVCIVDLPLDDPWMQHTFNSPGCDYVKSEKGQEYIHSVLSQSKEGKDGKHSKNHPDGAKSQTDLLVEKKYLDPPDLVPDITVSDAGSPQRGTDVCSVQKHSSFGRLKLFDVIKGDRKLTISLETPKKYEFIVKKLLKQLCDTAIHESKEGPTHKLMREWKETPEWIRHLQEFSLETRNQSHVHVYMVPDVMSRISSYQVWPHRNIRTGPLVEAGFTCKDPNNTTVECKSCGLELIASTLNGTNPTQYHREKSPKCEFFNQTNSQSRHVNIALTDQAPSPRGANQEAAHSLVLQSPGNNQQNKSSQAQAGKTSTANDASAQARRGSNDGNISIDNVTATTNHQLTRNASSLFSNNGAASFDSIVSERPRTEEVSDRTGVTVPNNNNMTLGGEAVRENENIIPGAQGGEVPYPIRNPRFTEQHARRESFTHWPHRAAHDIVNLVNAGFFYTGAEDIVRCFYCDIGLAEWTQDDDPWVEHARHSPECPYLRDQKGQDFINNIQTQWARIYTPKHPEYSQINVRRRSYENAGWPRDNVLQTPEQLAAAGFFYTGDGDTVRCHYCDGGLREWEPADNPWVEHARWFPFCKFVLKIKGIDFIQAAATGNPANGLQAPVAPPVAPQINQAPLTLSFVDRCRIKEQKNPMHSAAAQSLKTMGYSTETRRFVIDKFVALTGRRDFKAADLMDIIMAEEEAGRVFLESDGEDNDADSGATAGTAAAGGVNTIENDDEMEFSPAAMRKENEVLKQKFNCKVCGQRERCIVFFPCGHRITCERCGDQAITCSHCSCKIDQRFKTYLG